MAKKSRTPPPPRRVQAPRTRIGREGRDDRRRWLILVAVAASGFLGLGAVAALYQFGGGSGGAAALREAGCTIQTFPSQGRAHVETLSKGFKYNSFPPTSGQHNPVPAPFDVYEEPVEQMRLVHNLEHGAVVIQYGEDVPPATVTQIVEWYRDDPNGIVIAPLPALKSTIALAAWNAAPDRPGTEADPGTGILARCPTFDEDAFDAFVDTYGFKGPERFPKELLTPGS
ncbi:MAG: DUF3105 domain-containing protein [Gaiellaceae bacterium]